jgi:serine/threonine-protein kinase
MWIRADGSAEPQVLKKGDNQNPMVPHYLSADGRLAIYLQPISGSSSSWSIAIDQSDPEHPRAGEPQPLGQARMSGAAVSRDAHWLAYYSGQSGIPEVFVRPFSEGKVTGEAWQISAGGGAYPLWSKSRNELFYQTPEGRVMVVAYAADGKTFRPSKPRIWSTRRIGYSVVPGTSFFNSASRPYDITPDGDTIISWEADDQPRENKVDLHVNVLQNWFDEVDRRLGPER